MAVEYCQYYCKTDMEFWNFYCIWYFYSTLKGKGLSIRVNISSGSHWFFYVPPNSNWPFGNFMRDVCISILNPLRQVLEVFLSTSWRLRSWCNPGIYRLSGPINKNRFKIWYRYASIYWYRYASINGSRGGSIFVKILNFPVHRKIDVCMTSWRYIDAYR